MNTKIQEETIKKKLSSLGWKDNSRLILKLSSKKVDGIDYIFVKNKTKVKIKLIVNTKSNRLRYEYKRNKMLYLDVNWDFIISTNSKDIWVFPYEFLKRKDEKGYRISKSDDCFKNNFELLEMDEKHIMYFLMDNHLQNE